MKIRTKIVISLLAGMLAMLLHAAPMWWGVLFSPITRPLTAAPLTEDKETGFRWESDGVVLRLKSLDLLFSWLEP